MRIRESGWSSQIEKGAHAYVYAFTGGTSVELDRARATCVRRRSRLHSGNASLKTEPARARCSARIFTNRNHSTIGIVSFVVLRVPRSIRFRPPPLTWLGGRVHFGSYSSIARYYCSTDKCVRTGPRAHVSDGREILE